MIKSLFSFLFLYQTLALLFSMVKRGVLLSGKRKKNEMVNDETKETIEVARKSVCREFRVELSKVV